MDQIAANGFTFTNAFAQQSLCAPSRTSLLTSRRPDSLHLYDSHSYWRTSVANYTTLPQYFKQFGYFTQSIGKVFHPGIVSNHSDDYPLSWSAFPYHGSTEKYKFSSVCPSSDGNLGTNIVCPIDVTKQPEKTLPDIQSTDFAINFLKTYNNSQNIPFFLAIGYHKPHIPLKFPKQYLNLYPIFNIKLAKNKFIPKNFPKVAWNPWVDLRIRDDIKYLNISFPFGVIPDYYQKYILQSYYACVSYIDDMIGQVLQQLNDNKLTNNTIVILLGDHGWSLGEHNEWSKYSNFDVSLKVPLIIALPSNNLKTQYKHINPILNTITFNKSNNLRKIDSIVELVDVFPTIVDLSGLPVPDICTENKTELFCSEGVSLRPLLIKSLIKSNKSIKWKSYVFSQYPRPSTKPQYDSDQPKLRDIKIMGYSMSNSYLRYTEWIDFNNKLFLANWSQVYARELYFDSQQNYNMAYEPKLSKFIKYLSFILKKGWRRQLSLNKT